MLCFWGKYPFPGCLTVWPLESHGLQNRCLSTSWETHTWTPGVSSQHSLISGSPKRVPSFQVGIGHLAGGQGGLEKGKAHVATLVQQNFWLSSIFWMCQGTFTPRSTPSILCTWEGAIPWHRWGLNTGSALLLHIPPESGSCRKAGPNTWPQNMLPSREEVISLKWFCQVDTLNCALPAVSRQFLSPRQVKAGQPSSCFPSDKLMHYL